MKFSRKWVGKYIKISKSNVFLFHRIFVILVVLLAQESLSVEEQNIECSLRHHSNEGGRLQYACIFRGLTIGKDSKLLINTTDISDVSDEDIVFLYFWKSEVFLLHPDIQSKFPNLSGIEIVELQLNNQDSLQNCQNLKHLDFVLPDFSNISDTTFLNCPNLEWLSIDTDSITNFPENVFVNQRKLTSLSLAGSEFIFKIKPFERLTNLETLIFNPITSFKSIEINFFRSLTKLRSLKFLYKSLVNYQKLPIESLTFQKTLENLEVRFLDLRKIPDNFVPALRTMKNLRQLNLHHNLIESLDSFTNLDQLTVFHVNSNYLREIPRNLMKGCSNLEFLDLADNEITLIHPDSFDGLGSLKILDLQGNRIEKLVRGVFKYNYNVERIDFSHNRIKAIEPCDFLNNHPRLRTIDFTGNLCAHSNIQVGTLSFFGLQDKLSICYSSWFLNRRYLLQWIRQPTENP